MPATATDNPFSIMLRRVMALALIFGGPLWSAEMRVKNMSVPEFDSAGKMIRRVTAESASGDLIGKSQLKNGSVEFFDAKQENGEKIATLDFKDATYDRAHQIIEGDGQVRLHSSKGEITGKGFSYDLGRNHLVLKSDVSIDHNEMRVASGSGEVFLMQTPSVKEAVIKEATLKGGVVVTGKFDPKIDIEKAESERAVYTASNETIVLDSPIYYWEKGIKKRAEGEFTIHLGKRIKPAAPGERPKPLPFSQPN